MLNRSHSTRLFLVYPPPANANADFPDAGAREGRQLGRVREPIIERPHRHLLPQVRDTAVVRTALATRDPTRVWSQVVVNTLTHTHTTHIVVGGAQNEIGQSESPFVLLL